MPNFFIRERKVVRFIPRLAAAPSAPPTRPLHAVSAYDLITQPSFIFVSNAGLVALRICFFSSDLLDVMMNDMRERDRICFTEFSNRCLKRFATRHDDRPLDEILQLANVACPVPSRKPLHDCRRN